MLLVKVIVSGGLLYWVAATLDLSQVLDLFGRLSVQTLIVAFGLIVVQTIILGWRWHRVLDLLGRRLSPLTAIGWTFVGLFFNQALPGSVGGDVVRIWKLKQMGTKLDVSFTSVALERATGVALLSLLVSLCLPSVWNLLEHQIILLVLVALGPALCAGLYTIAFWHEKLAGYMPIAVGKLISAFGAGMRTLVNNPVHMLEVMGLGVLASLTGLLAAFVIALHLGMVVSFPAFVTLLGAAILASVLPISAGGWGVREASAVVIFGAAGMAPEQALTVSIAYGLLPLVISIPIGLAFWICGTWPRRRGDPRSDVDRSRSEG